MSLPGFSIPLIDLDQQAERQIVVDREAGQYLGHVTTVLLEDNKTMIAVYPKGHGRGAIVMKRSADGGLTWGEPEAISEHPAAHLCEPGAVRSPDGRQIAVLLRENSRKFNSMVIFSDDEGRTWTKPVELPGALTGDRHTGRYAPDGRLVFAFRDMAHESPTKGDFVAWVGKYDDIAQGREGQYRLRLKDNKKAADTTYPGVEVLPGGTFVVTTYGHWVEGEVPYILSVRFTLEEIDALAKR